MTYLVRNCANGGVKYAAWRVDERGARQPDRPASMIQRMFGLELLIPEINGGLYGTGSPAVGQQYTRFTQLVPAKPLLESGGETKLELVIQALIAEGPKTATIPLLRRPVVFTLLPVWELAGMLEEELARFMAVLQEKVDLAEIYAGVPPGAVYRLRAMVCYAA